MVADQLRDAGPGVIMDQDGAILQRLTHAQMQVLVILLLDVKVHALLIMLLMILIMMNMRVSINHQAEAQLLTLIMDAAMMENAGAGVMEEKGGAILLSRTNALVQNNVVLSISAAVKLVTIIETILKYMNEFTSLLRP